MGSSVGGRGDGVGAGAKDGAGAAAMDDAGAGGMDEVSAGGCVAFARFLGGWSVVGAAVDVAAVAGAFLGRPLLRGEGLMGEGDAVGIAVEAVAVEEVAAAVAAAAVDVVDFFGRPCFRRGGAVPRSVGAEAVGVMLAVVAEGVVVMSVMVATVGSARAAVGGAATAAVDVVDFFGRPRFRGAEGAIGSSIEGTPLTWSWTCFSQTARTPRVVGRMP